jgi:hypothetical protein
MGTKPYHYPALEKTVPRLTDGQTHSPKVIAILEDIDVVSVLQIAMLNRDERAEFVGSMKSWIENYAQHTTQANCPGEPLSTRCAPPADVLHASG